VLQGSVSFSILKYVEVCLHQFVEREFFSFLLFVHFGPEFFSLGQTLFLQNALSDLESTFCCSSNVHSGQYSDWEVPVNKSVPFRHWTNRSEDIDEFLFALVP
jgi:hypothetical protein